MKDDILERIISDKHIEVAKRVEAVTLAQLISIVDKTEYTQRSMSGYLESSTSGIIAEFKRRSPSKGWIKEDADISLIAPGYQSSGASAISVLTDEAYFGGRLDDLKLARSLVDIPLLRKDFIVNEYQLLEAKIAGADAILLIAAALTEKECLNFASTAHELGLEVLLELHTKSELGYINRHIDMVGINNRNLGTFHTDIQNSYQLFEYLPSELVKVSESGIDSVETIKGLQKLGYKGFLIGEQFMKSSNPSASLEAFIESI